MMDEERIKEIRKEYLTQDNRATAYPIFVTVQEQVCIGVIRDGYSVYCPYGDGTNKLVYTHDYIEGEYDSKEELIEQIREDYEDEAEDQIDEIDEHKLGYIWIDREWFLTIKGAEEYIKANKHNLGKTRTYVHHFHRRNFEMRELLEAINFTKDGGEE